MATSRPSTPQPRAASTPDGICVDSSQPTEEDIQTKPWKYIGIRGYSEFLVSDDDFLIFRRFGTLNTRVTLALQDELALLEQQLDELDAEYSDKNAEHRNNGTFRYDAEDRTELLEMLGEKLERYNELLIQQYRLRKIPSAPRRDVKSIRNWHYNHDYRAIDREEQKYLDFEEDLIAIAPKDKSALRRAIDSSRKLRTLTLWQRRDKDVPSYDSKYVRYYSDRRMDQSASAATIAIGVAMLLSPIWVLQATPDLQKKLIVITAFISVFLVVVSSFMTARPFEALAATAGYAAVLMVFIQLDDRGS